MTDEIRRLLGGYATGTLTEEERALLYEAALDDPAVFEAMEAEQPVRDLLENPSARAELLAAVQDRPFSLASALRDWLERPKSKVLVAVGLVLLVAIGVKQLMETQSRERPREVAQVLRTMPSAPEQPAAATLPAQREMPPGIQPLPAPAATHRKTAPAKSADTTAPEVKSMEGESRAPVAATTAPSLAPLGESTTPTGITWTLLRVDAAGNASPVPASYAFSDGEKARVQIASQQDGMIVARQGATVLYAGTVTSAVPVLLRDTASMDPVDIQFNQLTQAEAARSTVSAFRQRAPVMEAVRQQPEPQRLRITLQRKNP